MVAGWKAGYIEILYLGCEFKHQLLQQTFGAVLEDGDLGESWQMNADSDLCPQVQGQLLQDFIFPYDLFVDVEVLIPVVNALSKLLADVMATQVRLHLHEEEEHIFRFKSHSVYFVSDGKWPPFNVPAHGLERRHCLCPSGL